MQKTPDPIRDLEEVTQRLHTLIESQGKSVFERYPLTFALLATFGIAAVVYGFQELIDTIPPFQAHPLLVLLVGLVILFFTGSLYKRLSK